MTAVISKIYLTEIMCWLKSTFFGSPRGFKKVQQPQHRFVIYLRLGGESDREIFMAPACVILRLGSGVRIVLLGRVHQLHSGKVAPWGWERQFHSFFWKFNLHWDEVAVEKNRWYSYRSAWIKHMLGSRAAAAYIADL